MKYEIEKEKFEIEEEEYEIEEEEYEIRKEKYEIEEEKSGPQGKAITGEKKLLPRKASPPSVMAKRSCGVMITNIQHCFPVSAKKEASGAEQA